jgi:hypothetical protein
MAYLGVKRIFVFEERKILNTKVTKEFEGKTEERRRAIAEF